MNLLQKLRKAIRSSGRRIIPRRTTWKLQVMRELVSGIYDIGVANVVDDGDGKAISYLRVLP